MPVRGPATWTQSKPKPDHSSIAKPLCSPAPSQTQSTTSRCSPATSPHQLIPQQSRHAERQNKLTKLQNQPARPPRQRQSPVAMRLFPSICTYVLFPNYLPSPPFWAPVITAPRLPRPPFPLGLPLRRRGRNVGNRNLLPEEAGGGVSLGSVCKNCSFSFDGGSQGTIK